MALTTKQLCLINNLLYLSEPSIYESNPQTSYAEKTISQLVENINIQRNTNEFFTAQDWEVIIAEIKADEQLMNCRIETAYYDHINGDGGCVLFDPSSKEGVIAFRGTGKGEWKDNFAAGSTMNNGNADPTISVQQQKALDYVESLDLSKYNSVTVTGHSKGGNKAKICALFNENVDRCVSFDGQGFSDEFVEAHRNEIMQNQSKIENHNVDNDYVNILLNDVGTNTYYKSQNVGSNFAKNHSPTSFLSSDGEMIPASQSPDMIEMDRFLNSCLRSMSPKQKEKALYTLGEIASGIKGVKDGPNKEKEISANLRRILFDSRNEDSIAYLLAYTIKYEKETGLVTSSVSNVLNDMGWHDAKKIIAAVRAFMNNDFLYNATLIALKSNKDIPYWIISSFRKLVGIPFTDKEIRIFLNIISRTGWWVDIIKIDKTSGEDIRLPYVEKSNTVIENQSGGGGGISGANVVKVDFSDLKDIERELRRAGSELNQVATKINSMDISDMIGGVLKIRSSFRLKKGVVKGSNADSLLKAIGAAIQVLGDDSKNMAKALNRVAQMFQKNENQIKRQLTT